MPANTRPSQTTRSGNRGDRVGLLVRRSRAAPDQPTRTEERLVAIAAVLSHVGLAAEIVPFSEERASEVRRHVMDLAACLVWINPLQDGRDRRVVNALIAEAATAGVRVSAHPDVIHAIGTKEVLYRTRDFGWALPVELHTSAEELKAALRRHEQAAVTRVLKPLRGNDGDGVSRITPLGKGSWKVRRASDDQESVTDADEITVMLATSLASGGVIDQAAGDASELGMVRCYMSLDRCVGFARQLPRAPGRDAFAMKSEKVFHPREAPAFADLLAAMEEEWAPALLKATGVRRDEAPLLWDADFLFRRAPRAFPLALCEINASCVSPFPPEAPSVVAANLLRLLRGG